MELDLNKKDTLAEIPKQEWESRFKNVNIDFDRIILNHLIYKGFHSAAEEFAKEKNIEYEHDYTLKNRALIREEINHGNIDNAISKINDINAHLLDSNITSYYFLVEHKAAEMICEAHENDFEEKIEDVIQYIKNECGNIVEENKQLMSYLEDLMEYFIFNCDKIEKRREELAEFINEVLADSIGREDILSDAVVSVYENEKNLKEKYVFPSFNSYCK